MMLAYNRHVSLIETTVNALIRTERDSFIYLFLPISNRTAAYLGLHEGLICPARYVTKGSHVFRVRQLLGLRFWNLFLFLEQEDKHLQ